MTQSSSAAPAMVVKVVKQVPPGEDRGSLNPIHSVNVSSYESTGADIEMGDVYGGTSNKSEGDAESSEGGAGSTKESLVAMANKHKREYPGGEGDIIEVGTNASEAIAPRESYHSFCNHPCLCPASLALAPAPAPAPAPHPRHHAHWERTYPAVRRRYK